MNILNNSNLSQNNINTTNLLPSQTTINSLAGDNFINTSVVTDIIKKITSSDYVAAQDDINSLINILKLHNAELDIPEVTPPTPGGDKLPSILSSTDAYIKVFKALMEVLDELKAKEKEMRDKMKNEAEANKLAMEAEEMKKEMQNIVEKLQSKHLESHLYDQKEQKEVQNYLFYIRDKFNIDVTEKIKAKSLNTIV